MTYLKCIITKHSNLQQVTFGHEHTIISVLGDVTTIQDMTIPVNTVETTEKGGKWHLRNAGTIMKLCILTQATYESLTFTYFSSR